MAGIEMLLQTLAAQIRSSGTIYDEQAALSPPISSAQLCTFLKMNLQWLAQQGTAMHHTVPVNLLDISSPFSNLRLHPNTSITGAVAATYVFFLQHASEKIATESASCLKREMELLLAGLDPKTRAGKQHFVLNTLTESEILLLLRFDLTCLLMSVTEARKVPHAKDLIKFITEKLRPFDPPVSRYVDLHVASIQALRRLFGWLAPGFIKECSGVIIQGLSSGCLPVKLEVLEWINDLSSWFTATGDALDNNTVAALITASSDRETKVREHVAKTLEILIRRRCFEIFGLHAVACSAFERLSDLEANIRAVYGNLLASSSIAFLWLQGWKFKEKEVSASSHSRKQWRYLLAVKRFTHCLSPPQLLCILNYVSQRPQVLPSGWLQRLVSNCLRFSTQRELEDKTEITDTKNEKSLSPIFSHEEEEEIELVESWCSCSDEASAWFIIQEVARHCVAVRFRTHLGRPTQTFAALERMLLDLPQLATGSESQLFPMRLLLELVESLQRNIYNAYEGTLVLESPAVSSVLFFRANKKVCEEWFARIREALVNASVAIDCHYGTAEHALYRLHDLRQMALAALRTPSDANNSGNLKAKLQQDVVRAVRHGSLALCKLGESSSIIGLQSWVSTAFGALFVEDHKLSPFVWMNGLAFEARGAYERAAAHYIQLLQSEDAVSALGADGVQFTIGRIIESYVSLSDWEALERWLQELQALRTKYAGKPYAGALTTAGVDMNSVHALARFDGGDYDGTWSYLGLTPQINNEITVDPRVALQRSEQMLLQAMLRKPDEQEEAAVELKVAKTMLDGILTELTLDGVSDAAPYLTQLHCISVIESWRGLNEEHENIRENSSRIFEYLPDYIHQDIHSWLKVLRVYRTALPETDATGKLCHGLVRLARKQKNFRLARRLLNQMGQSFEMTKFENSLLLSSEGERDKAILELWPLTNSYILACQEKQDPGTFEAEVCLKLASWLRKEHNERLLSRMHLSSSNDVSSGDAGLISDEVIGTLNKAAAIMCPKFGKAWFAYASWCLSHARASFHNGENVPETRLFPQILDVEMRRKTSVLTEEERKKIQSLLHAAVSDGVSVEVEITITDMLTKRIITLMESTAGEPGFDTWDGEPPVTTFSLQLRQELQVLKPASVSNLISEILEIWWGVRRRRVELFGHAATGFLKYLSISTANVPEKGNTLEGDSTLSASLYVLHILQTYGVELEDVLQHGLFSVPPSPWQDITPQLFACLSGHPEVRVRKQLEGLLLNLANVYPWAIVYPTLVHLSASEGQSSEELECILNSLLKFHPKVVSDVKLMIGELGSITFLWEEQWLTTLQDLHPDVTRRIATLKEEATRVAENQTLSMEEKMKINSAKYTAIMAPIVVALERRLALTSRAPETPHEAWFQEHFGRQLKSAVATLKAPPTGSQNINALSDIWKPFDAITASLANHHRRSGVILKDVSPRLAALENSDAPMPGLESHGNITVAKFHEQVTILSTKTKPKKVSVTGSDGRVYTYLLKGREDLRLDARIMQLLRACNKMLRASSEGRRASLSTRCYSVTPISGRAGLIQWLDDVTSLYSVYKAWQLRTQAAQGGAPQAIPRPSDMFYGKIIPALKEKGLRKVISRRDWPQDVKRKVLLDLMKETPRQILYKELWCASDGLKGFNAKINRFSGSVAVTSIIGHIIGLGDRHLDNILIEFSSGDVVHIDYNICFEKGLRLKVPEIVPFRLTQTIQHALGPTGVEGMFRASCESVLRTLQKNKDVILMLLEAFIWDPLVEWMRGDGHDEATIGGEERRGMELAVSLSLFASHVQENRVALQEHHDQLLWSLPVVASTLQTWAAGYERFERCSTVAFHLNQKKTNIEKAEVAARALLAEASAALEKTHLTYELHAREFAQVKSLITEASRETSQWIETRSRVLESLRTDTVSEIRALEHMVYSPEAVSLLQAVIASGIAMSALPEPTQVACKELDKEITQLTAARQEALVHAGNTLRAYSLVLQRLLPANYFTTSYVHSWSQILQLLSRQVSPEVLAVANRQALELVARLRGDHDGSILQKHEKLRMHVDKLSQDVNNLEKERERVEVSMDPEAERRAKERVMGVFLRSLQKKDEEDGDEERRERVAHVLRMAVHVIYQQSYEALQHLELRKEEKGEMLRGFKSNWCFHELEEIVERCILVSELLSEFQHFASYYADISGFNSCLRSFSGCLMGIDHLVKQMIGVVLPEAVKAALSHDPAVMEAFASLSQIRGAVDTALEQAVEIEQQKLAFLELERGYPHKVEELERRRMFLEEAAAGGRDDLSWEEAEELASQEEICRQQLEKLQIAWSQRNAQAAALAGAEELVRTKLVSAEQRFESLIALDREDLHAVRGKVLLAAFANLFEKLEPLDSALRIRQPSRLETMKVLSSQLGLDSVFKASLILKDKTFFAWKLYVMDVILDACVRDAEVVDDDLHLGLSSEQLITEHKKRLEVQLQGLLDSYLKERLVPAFINAIEEVVDESGDKHEEPVKKAVKLLQEYCEVHEAVRASKSAALFLKARAQELRESLRDAQLEIARMEWLHDSALNMLPSSQIEELLSASESSATSVRWWSRKKILENIRTSIAAISRVTESLQKSELASFSAEEQLERTMSWSSGVSKIPQEFREHIRKRKQALWSGQEQAIGIVRLCVTVLEFEASREGYLESSTSASADGKAWQQTYQNLLLRLEATYLAFTNCDLEWKSAQSALEAASASLSNVLLELKVISGETDASGAELQSTYTQLRQLTLDASQAVNSFSKVVRSHSALTSEGAVMLEEVMALTEGVEGANEIHSLAKEAMAERKRLISDLKKVHAMVMTLEPLLTSTANTMVSEMDILGIIKSGSSSLLQSLDSKLKESLSDLHFLVSSVLDAAQKLHVALTNLGRAATVDAGTLNKAYEGREENSQAISASTDDVSPLETTTQNLKQDVETQEVVEDEESWISPPATQDSENLSQSVEEYSQFPEEANAGEAPSLHTAEEFHPRVLQATDGSFTFADVEKLNSGETRSGNEHKQHSSKDSSSNILSFPQSSNVDHHSRAVRGTAVSVLRRVRTKLEGRDIDETGQLSIAEQVDHLLRQATSIDNLCNMYEGWTPWI